MEASTVLALAASSVVAGTMVLVLRCVYTVWRDGKTSNGRKTMRNIAVVCRKSGMMKDFVLRQVAIDIDNLHIFPRRIIVGQWTYWHVSDLRDLTGIQWDYHIILGPIGTTQLEICDYLKIHGSELLPTFKIKEDFYGDRKPLENFPG